MNKGFTLVELLAVVVILSAIVLITRPVVINLMNDAKDDITKRSAEAYSNIVDDSFTKYVIDNTKIKDGTYYIMSNGNICLGFLHVGKCYGDEIKIETEADKPTSGFIEYEDDLIKGITFTYNKKIIYKDEDGKFVFDETEEPYLAGNTLVPVMYNGENWIIADAKDDLWYNYRQQQWANAVILKNGVTKKAGDAVSVDGTNPDVLAMFVWIPRYEYKIQGTYGKGGTSTSNPGEIEVNFISKEQTTPTEGYIIHPAFTFGKEELSGIWVGKFETSHSSPYSSLNCSNTNCSTADSLRILPNALSLRYNDVSNFFFGIRSMSRSGNTFRIDSNKLDTHMIKNSEWGAVAYLSQSKFGKYGNSYYTGTNKQVYINNSSSLYTGRSGGSPSASYTSSGTYKYDKPLINYYFEGFKNDTTYPWIITNDNVYRSTNHDHNTTSNLSYSFKLETSGTLTFDWSVSSESTSYDYVYYTIKKDGTTLSGTGTSNKIGGTGYGSSEDSLRYISVSKTLEPGIYEIIFTYRKDVSVHTGLDTAYIKNLKINGTTVKNSELDMHLETNLTNGEGASTTGNITGIYDMSGGANEYVMAVYSDSSGNLLTGYSSTSNSGFTGKLGSTGEKYNGVSLPDLKYYDLYVSYNNNAIDFTNACNNKMCYGHALEETKNWYNDMSNGLSFEYSWHLRGGGYNKSSSAGIFASANTTGYPTDTRSTRVIMVKVTK